MAGVPTDKREEILQQFPFECGSLPVRYLGLPLLTRRMTSADYLPLLEKIRSHVSSWTAKTLSFAGRLQLLSSVIFSLTNFWMEAFRLPKACIQEIDKICSAFLWSGPSLNTKKAKVAWSDVCVPKSEGGLGIRSLDEANKVCVLKLIWRILSAKGSLWVDWVKRYLIRSGSFWAEKQSSTYGSWIWKKILKYRETAKQFHRVEVNSGDTTSFWFDLWNPLGRPHDFLGDRGCIDLGIQIQSSVGEVMSMTRRKRHRQALLNRVEEEVTNQKQNQKQGVRDVALWKGKNDCYKKKFITRETWSQIRIAKPLMNGYKEIWFPNATPKYAFLTWLVVKNRIATGERMLQWNQNVDPSCILCKYPMENCDHLFFSCPYSRKVWEQLVKGILVDKFTQNWRDVMTLLASKELDKVKRFLVGYAFQNTIHSIWGERNNRRHGEQPATTEKLVRIIDKNVRNRMSTLTRGGNVALVGGLQTWFATRQD